MCKLSHLHTSTRRDCEKNSVSWNYCFVVFVFLFLPTSLYYTLLVLSNELPHHTVLQFEVMLFHSSVNSFCFSLPQRVVVYRILPALTSEFVNLDMVPFVLPNVLLIAEECTKEEYVRLILPDLSPVFKQQEPVQVRRTEMQRSAHEVRLPYACLKQSRFMFKHFYSGCLSMW